MKFYHFRIANKKIEKFVGIVPEPLPDFHLWETSFGGDIYYKSNKEGIMAVICEATDQSMAQKSVVLFLKNI